MNREQLFTRLIPDTSGMPEMERLSPLADYVLEEMPAELRAVDEKRMAKREDFELADGEPLSLSFESRLLEDLNAHQEAELTRVEDDICENEDPEVAEITQLDLLFMLGGRLPAGAELYRVTPPKLLDILRLQRERFGLPNLMDYEMIIDINAGEFYRTGQRDIRTYTDGQLGLDERDFYVGHHITEPLIKSVADGLKKVIKHPNEVDVSAEIDTVIGTFREFNGVMSRYHQIMPNESFKYISKYLSQYPGGVPNASGAYMPSVQLAELTLYEPTDEQRAYIDFAMDFFPRYSRDSIRQWYADAASGQNLEDMIHDGRLEVSDEQLDGLADVAQSLATFRQRHNSAVRSKIPGLMGEAPIKTSEILNHGEHPIFEEGAKGTGGFNAGNLLTNGNYRPLRFKRDLEAFKAARRTADS